MTAAALAVFTGTANAVGGPPPLVSDKVDKVDQLPPQAADAAVEAVSGAPPVPEDVLPPPLNSPVEEVGKSAHKPAAAALPPARVQAPPVEAPTGGVDPNSGTEARGQSNSSAPDAGSTAQVAAKLSPPIATGSAEQEALPVFSAPPPSAAERVAASPSKAGEAGGSSRASARSQRATPAGAVALGAPDVPVVRATAPEARSGANRPLPTLPPSTDSGLGGFEIPLPPLAAFALLLALPLGLLALTAPGVLGAGLCPDVALLRSADVRFRLVRPG